MIREEPSPSIIIHNGHVLSFNDEKFTALAIENNKILAVGNDKEILYLKNEQSRIIDAKGCTIIPGLIDAHTHFVSMGLGFRQINLFDTKSKQEALSIIKSHVDYLRTKEWVICRGWDESQWPEKEYITREELDSIADDIPILLYRIDGHMAVVNTKALSIVNVPSNTPGLDEKHGFLRENALEIAKKVIVKTREQLESGLELALEHALKYGITSIHENSTINEFSIFQEFFNLSPSKLTVRSYFLFWYTYLSHIRSLGLKTRFGNDMLRFGAIKVMVDGSVGARTAAFFEPYVDEPNNKGMQLVTEDELTDIIKTAHNSDLQLAIHAIGDKAIDVVLEAFKEVLKHSPQKYLRHRIEHYEFPTLEQIKLTRELELIPSMQPNFVANWGKPGGLYERRLGKERARRNNPFRDIINLGLPLAFGSDCMPMDPFYGIWAAVEHPILEQRLTIKEAFKAYTLNSAYASFEETIKGSIEPGKIADIVILSADVNSISPKEIRNLRPRFVIFNGRVVYQK